MENFADINSCAKAAHQATVAVHDYLEQEIVPVIHAQVATSQFEEAISGLYYRLVLWGRSLAKLSDPHHFQAVRSGSRTAFELQLDIYHLARDPALAEKMFAFTEVWKYHSSLKLSDCLKAHPQLDDPAFRHQKMRAGDSTKASEFEALLDRFWPSGTGKRKVPTDWFGGSIFDKARSAGPESSWPTVMSTDWRVCLPIPV